jgi:TPR repeat protein
MDRLCTHLLATALVFAAAMSQAAPPGPAPGQIPSGPLLRVDFVFDNPVRRTRDLPTAALRDTRRQMIAGQPVSRARLQALADHGDGLAAFRFARLLQEGAQPDPRGNAAHYYAIAAYTGRSFAVPPLARLLASDGAGYSESRLRHALNAMTVQALSGNAQAATLLGEMYATGVPFGHDPAEARHFTAMAVGDGDPRAALNLGVALMSDPQDAATGHPGAAAALAVAAAGDDLAVRATAQNLLRLIAAPPEPPEPAAPETKVTP